jgi:hypothetical protein
MGGWRIVPGQSLRHRCWDGSAVLYNDLSGATHQVSDAALSFLLDLRDGLIGAEVLADPVNGELLDSLCQLDLIEWI